MIKTLLKKIIPLAVAFVLGFVAIFFSVHAAPAFAGKGNGTSATVKGPEELSERLYSLPSSSYYYNGMYEDDDDFKGATIHETSSSYSSKSTSSSSYSMHESSRTRRTMDVYYGTTAAYYSVSITEVGEESRSYGDDSTETSFSSEVEFELYITAGKVFMRFGKLESVSYTRVYEDGVLVEDEDEEDGNVNAEQELQKDAQELWISTVRRNPNKWVALSNFSLDDLENGDFDEDDWEEVLGGNSTDIYEAYARMVCAAIASTLETVYIQSNDMNINALKQIGQYLQDESLYTKSGSIYTLDTSLLNSGVLMVDCSNSTAPCIYYNNYSSNSSEGGSSSESVSEVIEVTNINNTVVPSVPSSPKDMYGFIGNGVKNLVKKYADDLGL